MKSFIFALLIGLTSQTAFAQAGGGPWNRLFQDVKLPTQTVLEHYIAKNPVVASASNFVLNGAIASSASATTLTTFLAQPDFARNVVLTPTGTTGNVASGTAVVNGQNIFGQAISENFTITSSQSTATTGAKAFLKVTSVVFPGASGTGVTLNVGTGTKLGMNRCMINAGDYAWSEFGGVYDATRGTMVANKSAIESNTFIPNSAADGAHNIDVFYSGSFQCHP